MLTPGWSGHVRVLGGEERRGSGLSQVSHHLYQLIAGRRIITECVVLWGMMLSETVEASTRNAPRLPRAAALQLTITVAVAYFLAAYISLALVAKSGGITLVWLAAGLSAGILISLGRHARLPVVAGTMIASIIAHVMADRNIVPSTAFALCNAGEPLLVAWLIERYFGSGFSLDRLRNVMRLLAVAIAASAVSAIGGAVTSKLFLAPLVPIWTIWYHWTACGSVGIMTVAPLVIGLAEALRVRPRRGEIIEGVIALTALAAVMAVIIVSLPQKPWEMVAPVALLFPILWLAARCQPVFAAAAAFIVSLAIVWTMALGVGHFGDPALPIADRILGTQAAILGIALCAHILGALFAERRRAEQHRDLLIAELDHRVKNVLARVTAVVRHASRRETNEEFVKSLEGRIESIADAHSLLSKSRWGSVGLADLIRRQLAPYTTGANTSIAGPDIMLTAREIQALAVVIHELVTNAAKYGGLSIPNGSVSVRWALSEADSATLVITWRERGGPPAAGPTHYSYGTSLIRHLIPHEVGGTVDLTFSSDGTCCKIEIPLKRPAGVSGRFG
jgi:two-component sensor histidine kinase/integral membrane sensor domain MASE1